MTIIYAYVSKAIKQNGVVVSEIRAMQKVVYSIFNGIRATRRNGTNNIQKTMSKFIFTSMNKANPQPGMENKARKLVFLEIWYRVRADKIKNSMFES